MSYWHELKSHYDRYPLVTCSQAVTCSAYLSLLSLPPVTSNGSLALNAKVTEDTAGRISISFPMAQQPVVDQGHLIIEASRSHSDTPHSV